MARAAAGLCAALARRGHEVTVLTPLLDPGHAHDELREGVRVSRLWCPGLLGRRLVPWAPRLAHALDRAGERFDVAHLHGHRSPFSWAAAARLRSAGVPWVFQAHGTFPHHGRHRALKAAIDRLGGGRVWQDAAVVIAVSRAEGRELPRSAEVIPNGVAIAPAPPADRRAGRVLFVGSGHPQKRADRLPALLRALPAVTLTVVGPVSSRFAHRFGADRHRVELRGTLDPPALVRAYGESSVLVHPAVGEAFGFVPFEAALVGTPAVVAGGHGCGEWFGAAGGCVVPPDDAGALAGAVADRLSGRGLNEAGAVAGFCRDRLTWERCAEEVERVYGRVIAAGAAA